MADEGFRRKLTAILSADAVDYSRLMGEDEEATVRTLNAYREVFTALIQQHNGQVLDSTGDNLMAEFVSVVDAVQCAVAVQKEIKARNAQIQDDHDYNEASTRQYLIDDYLRRAGWDPSAENCREVTKPKIGMTTANAI